MIELPKILECPKMPKVKDNKNNKGWFSFDEFNKSQIALINKYKSFLETLENELKECHNEISYEFLISEVVLEEKVEQIETLDKIMKFIKKLKDYYEIE